MPSLSSPPIVSVIVPCYNGARYVSDAIRSLQEQSLRAIEIVVIDDGSTDASAEVISCLARNDGRIRFLRNPENLGLSRTRNRGLAESRGEFVAWLDCDDVAVATRLQDQLDFLVAHRDFGFVGSWVAELDEGGMLTGRRWILNAPPDDFAPTTLFRSYCWQSAMMLRREALGKACYDESFGIGEDYEFHARLSDTVRAWNLPKVLCHYRCHESNISRSQRGDYSPLRRIFRARLARLGLDPSENDLDLHQSLFNVETRSDRALPEIEGWLLRVRNANRVARAYRPLPFDRVIVKQLLYATWAAGMPLSQRVNAFLRSPVVRNSGLRAGDLGKVLWETLEKRRLGSAPSAPHMV